MANANVENTMDVLTKKVVDMRVAGYTFEQIAEQEEIAVTEIVAAWREYVDNRMVMSEEEQWVLHLLRLEDFLVKANARLKYCERAEDFELVLKLMDRLEALMALNKTRKTEAEDAVQRLTTAQTQIILGAMLRLQESLRGSLEQVFTEVQKPTKAVEVIKGEILNGFNDRFLSHAQLALMEEPES
jgi:hypothetical protein